MLQAAITLQKMLTELILVRRYTFRIYPKPWTSDLKDTSLTPYFQLKMRNVKAAAYAVTISCHHLQMKPATARPIEQAGHCTTILWHLISLLSISLFRCTKWRRSGGISFRQSYCDTPIQPVQDERSLSPSQMNNVCNKTGCGLRSRWKRRFEPKGQ